MFTSQVSRDGIFGSGGHSDGAKHYKVHDLVIRITSGPMEFSLEIDGKKYGSVAAQY